MGIKSITNIYLLQRDKKDILNIREERSIKRCSRRQSH